MKNMIKKLMGIHSSPTDSVALAKVASPHLFLAITLALALPAAA